MPWAAPVPSTVWTIFTPEGGVSGDYGESAGGESGEANGERRDFMVFL
jgi:hypothetical protein